MLDNLLHLKARWLMVIAALAALAMTALVVAASIMRYALGKPFAFTEELVALLYVTMQFLTIPLCTLKNQHIRIGLVTEHISARSRRLLLVLANMVTVVFCAWVVWETYKFAAFSHVIVSRSEQVEFLLWPWMAIMPAAMLATLAIVLVQTVRSIADAVAGRDPRDFGDTAGDGT